MRNCTFIGNHAGAGGGIEVSSGLNVSNSTFVGNSAAGIGGAIAGNQGPIAVSDSTFSGNSALSGGGIYAVELSTVRNSTFSGNSADNGGGIYTSGWASYAIEVSNSTFSDNSAVHDGGGIYHRDGTVEVTNSSLADNQAASGGGIYSHPDGTVMLKNTIVASNPSAENCAGTITDGGGNLSFPDATCPGINADPMLGPLQNNGGPTETMALGPSSAAIDAGIDAICAAPPVNNLDQRGIARPQGAHCDIGALEQILEPAAVSVSVLSAQSLPSTTTPAMVAGLLLAMLVAVGKGGSMFTRRHILSWTIVLVLLLPASSATALSEAAAEPPQPSQASATDPRALDPAEPDWYAAVQEDIRQSEYQVTPLTGTGWQQETGLPNLVTGC